MQIRTTRNTNKSVKIILNQILCTITGFLLSE